ncbi:MAG: NUDIX hydrolase [Pseudomonadota bacterium]
MNRFDPHITVATVVERDGRYLLVEESPHGEPVYNQPAGHVEGGESLVDGACREALEETGWRVRPTHLLGLYVWTSPKNGATYYRVAFAGELLEKVEGYAIDKDIDAVHWLTLEEIRARHAQLRSPLVLRCVEDHAAGRRFPLELIFDADELVRRGGGA